MEQQGTIDHTIGLLDGIIDSAVEAGSYLAVFPAMYRSVTTEVRRANAEGFFDDAPRLERLVVTFAGLYCDALTCHRDGSQAPQCWELAFRAAESRRRRAILQHLLLGMNAHINFDLGIATARIGGPDELPSVYADYLRVNEVLFTLVDQLQTGLNAVSPWMRLMDRVGQSADEGFMRLGLRTCRDRAWRFAERLAGAEEHELEEIVRERDADVRRLGGLISSRMSLFHAVNVVVKARESRDVALVVEAFQSQVVDLDEVASRVTSQLETYPTHQTPLRWSRRGGFG